MTVPARYVGLYWTLPVNWAGFRNLPLDVDAAAAVSRTIRYQRERVRSYVQANGGILKAELAFMDTRPDRATDAVRDVLRRAAPGLVERPITVLAVRFADISLWRHNPFMQEAADELELDLLQLSPDPLLIDGRLFDPAHHFSAWRTVDSSNKTRLRLEAFAGLRTALAETPVHDGRWIAIADTLNERGIKTTTGHHWTDQNVRKTATRLGLT